MKKLSGKARQKARKRQQASNQVRSGAVGLASRSSASPRVRRGPWLFREPRAGELTALEGLDGFAPLRNGLRKVAEERGEWAGIPMPLDGQRLIIEPTYPGAAGLMAIGPEPEDQDAAATPEATIRNVFWSWSKRCDVAIFEEAGKIDWCPFRKGSMHHLAQDLETLRSADAWGIEQESAATRQLASLIQHRQFRQYMLTGMFMERSRRSGVHYLFRRLKPTVAFTQRTGYLTSRGEGRIRILCCLCMHPIGYYAGSWAGAMTPTDDILAHLMLMRGDERMFWARCQQHSSWRPEAGL